jgi:hypothetical protein
VYHIVGGGQTLQHAIMRQAGVLLARKREQGDLRGDNEQWQAVSIQQQVTSYQRSHTIRQ